MIQNIKIVNLNQLVSKTYLLLLIPIISNFHDSSQAVAQIVPDNTLGTENSTIKQDNLNGLPIDLIEGGATRGKNLFHSFTEFNIEAGKGAYFANPKGIDNIFSRVTGSNPSQIMGTLGVLGNSNLFFLNPNGIIFGSNARLDIKGSFLATSADSLLFPNGFAFSSANPKAPPLLTVSIPVGLGFRTNPGSILNQSARESVGLQVPDGQSLLLVGGDVRLDSGRLSVPGGQIELGGLAASGTIGLSVDDNNLNLSFPDNTALADVSLTNFARVGGSSPFSNEDDGEIQIWGNRVTLDNASFIFSYTFGDREGKGISIQASQLTLEDNSFVRTNVLGGSEKGGNVSIEAEKLTLETGAEISTLTTFGSGNAGNISIEVEGLSITGIGKLSTNTSSSGDGGNLTVRASEIKLRGTTADGSFSSGIFARVGQGAEGNGGNLTIETGRLILQDGAKVSTEVFGKGQGGNLSVTASESIELIGRSAQGLTPSALFARTEGPTVDAKAGDLTIATGKLIITGGAQVSASTFGLGDAGDLTVRATEVELSGTSVKGFPSGLFAQVNMAEGNGGQLTIETEKLIVRNGAEVTSAIARSGGGQAGNLNITASELVKVSGVSDFGFPSRLLTQTDGDGNAGDLTITTERLIIRDGAEISTSTSAGKGQAGNLSIIATDSVEIVGKSEDGNPSNLVTVTFAAGDAGKLKINTDRLIVADDALVSSFTGGFGNAGELTIDTRQMFIQDGAAIVAGVGISGEGRGGKLTVRASELLEVSGTSADDESASLLSTRTLGAGTGGDLKIQTGQLIVRDEAEISASTSGTGKPGNIAIQNADSVLLSNNGSISTAVEFEAIVSNSPAEQSGNIDIQTRLLSLTDGAEVTANTSGQGDAGSIFVRDAKEVSLSNSSISTSVNTQAIGQGGMIDIQTGFLSLGNQSQITASTSGEGNAGKLTITADTLTAAKNSTIQTNTASNGQAGDITLKIEDSLDLTASAIEAITSAESTGDGGNISIDPIQVNLTDGANISVNSQGRGNGGSIFLIADNVTLNNASAISAATASGEGGNITFSISDILRLRNNSPISATAGGTGNGGNIAIDNDFLIASDNSDITANAFKGQGGNINITTQGLFLSPDSEITASSELGVDGIVEIDTPENDPSRGLVDLPENVVNPEDLISQNACKHGGTSKFSLTGRGGLPSTPEQIHNSDEVEVDLVKPVMGVAAMDNELPVTERTRKIVPAKGWIRNQQGEVILVEYDPTESNVTSESENLDLCQPQGDD